MVAKDAADPGTRRSLTAVQRTLGLLFAPVSVIALLCNVLGLSVRNTASISLASIILTAIILYRGAINRTVPSSLVCGLLVGLVAVFTANYEHIIFKDTGLIRYFHSSNNFLGENEGFFTGAKKEIWFVGLDFHITAGDRKDLILTELEKGIKVRFLVFNPDSPLLTNIAVDFDQDPRALSSECTQSIENILALRNEWLRRPASAMYPEGLEIKTFEDVPHARLYIVDPDDNRGQAYYNPYMNRESSPVLPGYLLSNIKGGVMQEYLPGVRRLWSTAQSVEIYESRHKVAP
jgi:hypothetical protein